MSQGSCGLTQTLTPTSRVTLHRRWDAPRGFERLQGLTSPYQSLPSFVLVLVVLTAAFVAFETLSSAAGIVSS